jgi:hypothetical protein
VGKSKPDPAKWAKANSPTPEQEATAYLATSRASEDRHRQARVNKALAAQMDDMQRRLDLLGAMESKGRGPVWKGSPRRGTKQAMPWFLASDWHVEERVDPETVNGRNEYNPDIATRRAQRFTDGLLWLLDGHASMASMDAVGLWLGGDFITNYIHPELEESNHLSPVDAVQFAANLIEAVIRRILKETTLKVEVPCSYGNHDRLQMKKRIQTGAENSLAVLMYRFLRKIFRDEPRVAFHIATGYHLYYECFDKVLRFHHGDAVQYQGGVGGVTIPMRKKIAGWNRTRVADLDLLGHFHQLQDGGSFIVNGSLIGHNPYAIEIGASYEAPQQAFFLMRPERGKSATAPVFVT